MVRSRESRRVGLVPILRGLAGRYMLKNATSCGIYIDALYQIEEVPFFSYLVEHLFKKSGIHTEFQKSFFLLICFF